MNIDDLEPVTEVFEPGCSYRADKGLASRGYQEEWRESNGVLVRAAPQCSRRLACRLRLLAHRLRQMIVVVNAQLGEHLSLEPTRAQTLLGLVTRVQAKLTTHTLGTYLHALSDTPTPALKDLVV